MSPRLERCIASIARLLGVSRSTHYKYVPELKPGSDLQAIDPPTEDVAVTQQPKTTNP